MQACVRKLKLFDAEMNDFVHTPPVRGAFTRARRHECSKLRAVPCASLLTLAQNRSRPDNSLIGFRP